MTQEEKRKNDLVDGKFITCIKSFDGFKDWFEKQDDKDKPTHSTSFKNVQWTIKDTKDAWAYIFGKISEK